MIYGLMSVTRLKRGHCQRAYSSDYLLQFDTGEKVIVTVKKTCCRIKYVLCVICFGDIVYLIIFEVCERLCHFINVFENVLWQSVKNVGAASARSGYGT